MVIKTNADIVKALRGFYDSHIQSLNGILDKLPEAVRGDLQKLRDSLNAQLEKLPPLEQVPAAQDAAWAFNSLSDAVVRMHEYASGMLERLTAMSKQLAERVSAFNGLDEQIKKGELLPKDQVKTLCDSARDEGVKSVMPMVSAMRKQAVELAGLPMPGEDVLALPAEQWNTRCEAAKKNVTALGEKGLKLGGRGAATAAAAVPRVVSLKNWRRGCARGLFAAGVRNWV